MAAEILQAILTKNPFEHEPRHDIESFIYVLAYSLARRAVLESQPLEDSLRRRLHSFFILRLGGWSLMMSGPLGKDKDRSQFACFSRISSPRPWQSSWIIWTVGWHSPDYPWNGIPNRSLIHICCLYWTRWLERLFDISQRIFFFFGWNLTLRAGLMKECN